MAALLIFAVIFVSLEIVFRATGLFMPPMFRKSAIPGAGFESKPNMKYRIGDVEVRFNKMGFRDTEFTEKKKAGVFRIVCLGDSMTAAVKLHEKDTWPKVLQRELERDGIKTEVLNMSVPGYNTAQEWLVYENKAKQLAPDLVIVQFLLNDLTYAYPVYTGVSPIGKLKVWLGDNLRTYRFVVFLKSIILKRAASSEPTDNAPEKTPDNMKFMTPIYSDESDFFRNWKKAAAKFGAEEREGRKFLFVIFPWTTYTGMEKGEAYPFFSLHEKIASVLRAEGIPSLDVTRPLVSEDNLKKYWVSPDDFHLNARAHDIIAKEIENKVRATLIGSEPKD